MRVYTKDWNACFTLKRIGRVRMDKFYWILNWLMIWNCGMNLTEKIANDRRIKVLEKGRVFWAIRKTNFL